MAQVHSEQQRKAVMKQHSWESLLVRAVDSILTPAPPTSVPQSAHQSSPSTASPQIRASSSLLFMKTDESPANRSQASLAVREEAGMAAAEYDPNADIVADRKRQRNGEGVEEGLAGREGWDKHDVTDI
jgi:hypothetical protein